MSQYTITSKYGKRTRLQGSKKFFPQDARASGENRFAPLLNEREVIGLFENTIPGSIKKATKCGIFQDKNLKTLF